jgi:hypothetical protein
LKEAVLQFGRARDRQHRTRAQLGDAAGDATAKAAGITDDGDNSPSNMRGLGASGSGGSPAKDGVRGLVRSLQSKDAQQKLRRKAFLGEEMSREAASDEVRAHSQAGVEWEAGVLLVVVSGDCYGGRAYAW